MDPRVRPLRSSNAVVQRGQRPLRGQARRGRSDVDAARLMRFTRSRAVWTHARRGRGARVLDCGQWWTRPRPSRLLRRPASASPPPVAAAASAIGPRPSVVGPRPHRLSPRGSDDAQTRSRLQTERRPPRSLAGRSSRSRPGEASAGRPLCCPLHLSQLCSLHCTAHCPIVRARALGLGYSAGGPWALCWAMSAVASSDQSLGPRPCAQTAQALSSSGPPGAVPVVSEDWETAGTSLNCSHCSNTAGLSQRGCAVSESGLRSPASPAQTSRRLGSGHSGH